MAVIQRSLGDDQQKKFISFDFAADIAKGHSGIIAVIPFPCVLNAIQIVSIEHVDSPYINLNIMRFIPNYGPTLIPLTSSFVVPIFGTSGAFANGVTLPSSGSTLLKLMANDVLHFVCDAGSANGKILGVAGILVLTPVQDRITFFTNI